METFTSEPELSRSRQTTNAETDRIMDTKSNVIREDDFKPATNVPLDRYNHNIQFYTIDIPGGVSFEDFRKLGLLRMTIHGIAREINEKDPRKCCEILVARLRELGLKSFADLFSGGGYDDDNEELRWARWRDHASHNAACLGLSQKRKTQFWLKEAEYKLLRWRLSALSDGAIESCAKKNNIRYPTIDRDEKLRLRDDLKAMIPDASGDIDETIFYKVPYLDACDVIAERKTFLESGNVYLTLPLLRSAIYHRFRRHWKTQIKKFQDSHLTGDEPKLPELVGSIRKRYDAMIPPCETPEIPRIEDLDSLSKTSYPPCMRKLHEALRADHHLRNDGRVQYTLFLKAIGIEADAALEFFRDEFTQTMDDQAFEKEYAYYVRHLYGLVGGRKQRGLPNCETFAGWSVGVKEYHGCPFAHGDIEDLDKMLVRWEIPDESRRHIAELSGRRKFGDACSTYFATTQGFPSGCSIVNPMDFYRQSRQIPNPEEAGPCPNGGERIVGNMEEDFYGGNAWEDEEVLKE